MAFRPLHEPESDAVYAELVANLFGLAGPTVLMLPLFAGVGLFVTISASDPTGAAITILGTALIVLRLLIGLAYRHVAPVRERARAALWERSYCFGAIALGGAIAALNVRTIMLGRADVQMISLCLLFGYCSGVVTRLSVRPIVAIPTVLLTCIPVIVASAIIPHLENRIVAVLLLLFMLGGLETSMYLYRAVCSHVTTALTMEDSAGRDMLTGLFNRFGLAKAFARLPARDEGAGIAVHYFDVDRFKWVNDRYGHAAGDALLVQVAQRLSGILRETDIAARIGGDEFILIQNPVDRPETVALLIDRLRADLSLPYRIGDLTLMVDTSFGSALSTDAAADDAGTDLPTLMARADRMLYEVKQARRPIAA